MMESQSKLLVLTGFLMLNSCQALAGWFDFLKPEQPAKKANSSFAERASFVGLSLGMKLDAFESNDLFKSCLDKSEELSIPKSIGRFFQCTPTGNKSVGTVLIHFYKNELALIGVFFGRAGETRLDAIKAKDGVIGKFGKPDFDGPLDMRCAYPMNPLAKVGTTDALQSLWKIEWASQKVDSACLFHAPAQEGGTFAIFLRLLDVDKWFEYEDLRNKNQTNR